MKLALAHPQPTQCCLGPALARPAPPPPQCITVQRKDQACRLTWDLPRSFHAQTVGCAPPSSRICKVNPSPKAPTLGRRRH